MAVAARVARMKVKRMLIVGEMGFFKGIAVFGCCSLVRVCELRVQGEIMGPYIHFEVSANSKSLQYLSNNWRYNPNAGTWFGRLREGLGQRSPTSFLVSYTKDRRRVTQLHSPLAKRRIMRKEHSLIHRWFQKRGDIKKQSLS